MKKYIILLLSLMLILPISAFASSSNDMDQFKQGIEKGLVKGDNYYAKGSMQVVKSIQLKNATITRVITPDDPATPQDETKIDKHSINLIVGLVDLKEKRDRIFSFDQKEIYYYDVTDNQFVVYGDVYGNPEVQKFFTNHLKELGKHLDTSSLVMLMVFISTLFILACTIFIFNNEHRSNQKFFLKESQYSSSF